MDFTDICRLWPSARVLAEDLKAPESTVKKWRERNSVPAAYWLDLLACAKRRGYRRLTLPQLARIAAQERVR